MLMHKPPAPQDPRKLEEWTDDQLTLHMDTNLACTQCHEGFETDEQITAHTHHPPRSSGSLCYNCHMPYTTYGLLKSIRSHTVSSPNIVESLEHGRPNACNLCHLDQTLAWTDRELVEGWGVDSTFRPGVTTSKRSAAAMWLLEGDAGQRALIAWAMGWGASHEASGSEWMAPLLAELLDDPYMAVRFITRRSLSTLPGMSEINIESGGPTAARSRVLSAWRSRARGDALPMAGLGRVYLTHEGNLDEAAVQTAKSKRDDRLVNLAE